LGNNWAMAGDLLTLPLRLGIYGTRIFWRTAEGLAGRAVTAAVQVASVFSHQDSASATAPQQAAEPPPRTRPARRPPSTPVQTPRTPPAESAPSGSRPTPPSGGPAPIVSAPAPDEGELPPVVPEPIHVSEEPELVREEAELGAEEGAGASVRINPPWEGYDRMGAREVIARLESAGAAELTAVQLYESSNRSRRTVLEAIERRIKAANGRG
jgi:hypothetical protein